MKIKNLECQIGDYVRHCTGGPGKTASSRGWYCMTTYKVMDISNSDGVKPVLKMKEVSPNEIDKRRTLHQMGGADGIHPRFKKIVEVDENGELVKGSVWNRDRDKIYSAVVSDDDDDDSEDDEVRNPSERG